VSSEQDPPGFARCWSFARVIACDVVTGLPRRAGVSDDRRTSGSSATATATTTDTNLDGGSSAVTRYLS